MGSERGLRSCITIAYKHSQSISSSTGIFPKVAYSALIKPLLKKSSLDHTELKIYRPMSNLTFLGELIEKAACKQLVHHINNSG